MRICNDFLETFNKEFKGQKYSQNAHWKQGHAFLNCIKDSSTCTRYCHRPII